MRRDWYLCIFSVFFGYIVHVCVPGSKLKSRSEDDLLTPQCVSTNTSSWSGDTPDIGLTFPRDSFSETPASSYGSEPTITVSNLRSSAVLFPRASCCVSGDSFGEDRSHTGPHATENQARFRRSIFTQPSLNLKTTLAQTLTWVCLRKPHTNLNQTITMWRSPNRDDASTYRQCSVRQRTDTVCEDQPRRVSCLENENRAFLKNATGDCSQLIDALDIQSPVAFRLDTSSRVQSTPYATRSRTNANTSLPRESLLTDKTDSPQDQAEKPQNHPGANETRRMRVADQINSSIWWRSIHPKSKRSDLLWSSSARRSGSPSGD